MSKGILKGIRISGMVCALPDNKINTLDHTDRFDLHVLERMVEETGVVSTYRTTEKQTASDLCYEAAEHLIGSLGWEKSSIGALIFVSHALDYQRPATAGVIQYRLGLEKECSCLDVSLGCSGFIYGVSVLGSLMSTMNIQRAILCCGDLSSKAVSPETTSNLLFGDVGSAVAMEKCEDAADIRFALLSDGSRFKKIFTRGGGFRHPEDHVNIYADMLGMDVLAFSITDVPKAIKTFMADNELDMEQLDLVALHQANELIIRQIARKIKAPEEKVPVVLTKYGNTSSSSIPLAVCDHILQQQERKTLHFLGSGFGLGLSWAVGDLVIPEDAFVDITVTSNYFDDDNEVTVTP